MAVSDLSRFMATVFSAAVLNVYENSQQPVLLIFTITKENSITKQEVLEL